MSKRHKSLAFLAAITLFLGFFLLAVIAIWSFYPYRVEDIITFKEGSHTISKKVLNQGEDTTYLVDYCKYQMVPNTVEKQFADGILFRSDDLASKLSLGCHKELVPLHIPETLPPGRYKYRIIARYQVNPLKVVELVRETGWFDVVNPKEAAE